MRFAGNRDLRLPIQDVCQRVKRRRVLAQPLPLIKRKHRHRPRLPLHHLAADDRPRLIIDHIDNPMRHHPKFTNRLLLRIAFHITPLRIAESNV